MCKLRRWASAIWSGNKSEEVKCGVMTKKELESLREFCVSRWPEKMGATHGVEITANICFDSDRMDLLRVGILPVPERMATKRGAELVGNPNYSDDYHRFVEQAMMRYNKRKSR